MKEVVKIIFFPLLKLIYELVGIAPRHKHYWGISCSFDNRFMDNAKYLYLYLLENHKEISSVWFASDRETYLKLTSIGGRVVMKNSLKGVYNAIRCKYWFVTGGRTDINFFLSKGATVINLWHGIPLKKIGLDVDFGKAFERYNKNSYTYKYLYRLMDWLPPDYLISTSGYVTQYSFSSAFGLPVEKCPPFGYPRLDIFFCSPEERLEKLRVWKMADEIELITKMRSVSKAIIYMPTFRDDNLSFFEDIDIDFIDLNRRLSEKNQLMVVKLHPITSIPNKLLEQKFSSIIFVNPLVDVYSILPETSALVTDYSSIYFDYLLLDKPVYFYCYDLENYKRKARGLYFDNYEEITPGLKLLKSSEFIEVLLSEQATDECAESRKKLREKIFEYKDGGASRRIVNFVKGLNHG